MVNRPLIDDHRPDRMQGVLSGRWSINIIVWTMEGYDREEQKENVVRTVYIDWRLRSRIEHGYRFDQEQGLDVEGMRVQRLERMQRLFLLVLAAAQFVFYST